MAKENSYNKFTLRCDKCGHPILYDEHKLAQLKADLTDQIANIDIQLGLNKADQNWRLRAKVKKRHLIKDIADLKLASHAATVKKQKDKLQVFAEIMFEKLGKDEYSRYMDQAEEMLICDTGRIMTEKKAVEGINVN